MEEEIEEMETRHRLSPFPNAIKLLIISKNAYTFSAAKPVRQRNK